jgi:hypothetical protein
MQIEQIYRMSGSRSLLYNFKRRGGYYRSAGGTTLPYRLERDVKLEIHFETHFMLTLYQDI